MFIFLVTDQFIPHFICELKKNADKSPKAFVENY